MVNPQNGGQGHRQGPTQDRKDQKVARGFLALGHAFFEKYKSDRAEDDNNKNTERSWIRYGAVASIAYTAITLVIMILTICQERVSRQTEVGQLRAYVGVFDKEIVHIASDNDSYPGYEIFVRWKNFGASIAYDTAIRIVRPRICNSLVNYPRSTKESDQPMFPSQTTDTDSIRVPNEYLNPNYCFWTRADYSDMFGTAHTTIFCYSINFIRPLIDKQKSVAGFQAQFGPCGTFEGCADDECKKYDGPPTAPDWQ